MIVRKVHHGARSLQNDAGSNPSQRKGFACLTTDSMTSIAAS